MTTESSISLPKVIPWVEKYRPDTMDGIVLDDINKSIFKNIFKSRDFPNLIFYGPPGTGKTTTVINIIQKYQDIQGMRTKDLIIHLNASDERGVDVIRTQINQFVSSSTMFHTGLKFVILDEVDYMTKPAQQALKCLIQSQSNNVRYCLICNYISRIEESLQTNFVKLRFNNPPTSQIIKLLKRISVQEGLTLPSKTFNKIQQLYKSDVRSMINFLQINQNRQINVIHNGIWESIFISLLSKSLNKTQLIISKFNKISIDYNIDVKNSIKKFLLYIIFSKKEIKTHLLVTIADEIIHTSDIDTDCVINYMIMRLESLIIGEDKLDEPNTRIL